MNKNLKNKIEKEKREYYPYLEGDNRLIGPVHVKKKFYFYNHNDYTAQNTNDNKGPKLVKKK